MLQLMPSQCSMSVWTEALDPPGEARPCKPTAQTSLTDNALTSNKALYFWTMFAPGVMSHEMPFQCRLTFWLSSRRCYSRSPRRPSRKVQIPT